VEIVFAVLIFTSWSIKYSSFSFLHWYLGSHPRPIWQNMIIIPLSKENRVITIIITTLLKNVNTFIYFVSRKCNVLWCTGRVCKLYVAVGLTSPLMYKRFKSQSSHWQPEYFYL
jgi:hypothetical protein